MKSITFFLLAILFIACGNPAPPEKEAPATPLPTHNQLTDAEKAAGWQLLFDGQSTDAWRLFNQEKIAGWAVENGEMVALGKAGQENVGADIITKDEFENFELKLEWKISKAGNSGIFFNVVEGEEYFAVYETGPEYQLLDDIGFPAELKEWQKSGANYAMHPPAKAAAKPQGEFNKTRLLVNKGHVEHWLNGEKVVEYELWSGDWNQRVADGKWKGYPGYGKAKKGHIALQDHGQQIWFRNIKVRRL